MQQAPAVIITRPEPQASDWAQALQRELGDRARVLVWPLIEIAAVEHAAYRERLHAAWEQLPQTAAAFFVSVPAVEHFFAAVPDAAARWNAGHTRAWAPGRGTLQALLQAGVDPARIDSPPPDVAQFDSEALWPLIQPQLAAARQAGRCVLRVRGTDDPKPDAIQPDYGAGRDWMGEQLAQAGLEVRTVVAYQRQAPRWAPAQQETVRTLASQRNLWLWSSSQALNHLQTLLPQQDWSQATALATHPRIAARAREAGYGTILQTRPTLHDVSHSIQSWL